MEYVINILEKDKYILEKCLSEWESEEYPLAKKERENKLKELELAILYLKQYKITDIS